MSTPANILIVLATIAANAFFAASEIAIVSLKDAKVRRDADDGDRAAQLLRKFIDAPGRFLATIQIGSNLASFFIAAFVAINFTKPIAARLGVPLGVTTMAMTVVLTFVMIVFGEMVPRRIALKYSGQLARIVVRPLRFVAQITHPFVLLLNFTSDRILRLLGISIETEKERASEEEILMMADIAEEAGAIEPQEKKMIENVFEFNNKNADEIMVHRKDIVGLPVNAQPDEVRALILGSGNSRIPVYLETIDDILGILNVRDYLVAMLSGENIALDKLMRKPLFVPETIHADHLFRKMQKMKCSIAVVLDEHGGTSGIVTVEDLLEEIVGEIYDEHDADTAPVIIRKISDNEYRMPGEIGIDKVAEELEVEIEEGDFNTIGGYIFEKLNAVPSEGTVLEDTVHGLEFKVEKMDGRRIESVIVRKVTPKAEDESAIE